MVDINQKPLAYVDYNRGKDDFEKIRPFLTDTQNFFSSFIYEYENYGILDKNERECLTQFIKDANKGIDEF